MDNRQRENWEHPQPQYRNRQGEWVPNPNYPDPQSGMVGFFDAIKICFRKYANFSGRAPRAEFWWWTLFTFILGWIPFVDIIAGIVLLIPSLAVTCRRLHDVGKAAGWIFISMVPIVGWILMLIWELKDGEPHPNRFGPNPYGIDDGMGY